MAPFTTPDHLYYQVGSSRRGFRQHLASRLVPRASIGQGRSRQLRGCGLTIRECNRDRDQAGLVSNRSHAVYTLA